LDNFLQENEYFSRRFSPELYLTRTSWPIRFIERKRIEKIAGLVNPDDNDRILDVGCGTGDILIEIMKRNNKARLFGIDASAYMTKRAAQRTREKIIKSVAERLPFENNFFDKVLCSEVLEHVQNMKKSIDEISRVLKPGGVFVISYPDENLINLTKTVINLLRMEKIVFPGEYMPESDMSEHWHRRKIDTKDLIGILKKHGLKINKIFHHPFIFPVKRIVYGYK
jgi:ubiquinone/menaquinone biosynthesis C-methylase UbiE